MQPRENFGLELDDSPILRLHDCSVRLCFFFFFFVSSSFGTLSDAVNCNQLMTYPPLQLQNILVYEFLALRRKDADGSCGRFAKIWFIERFAPS